MMMGIFIFSLLSRRLFQNCSGRTCSLCRSDSWILNRSKPSESWFQERLEDFKGHLQHFCFVLMNLEEFHSHQSLIFRE